ncbi:NrsF family protein, partial [Leptospira sp. SA-E8]|uniref:NrsF family protein n=1 Tax=Leptospira sp. SA-E8 TaxID=3422259 RepID=UPI003EB8AE5A
MKTKDMVAMLAAGVEPVDRHVLGKRFLGALLMGGVGALVLMLLRFGLRPDLVAMLSEPLFWIKMAFPLLLAVAAFVAAVRLSRPGVPVGSLGWAALGAPVLVVWVAAVVVWLAAPV